MTIARAPAPEPVSTSTFGCFEARALGVLPLPDLLETGSCPWPQVRTSTLDSAEAHAGAAFLSWDIVDEWGAQSFPASDPPANW